jgi:hypothetical protein
MQNYSFLLFDIQQRLLLKFEQYLYRKQNFKYQIRLIQNIRAGNLLTLCATRLSKRAARF